MIKKQENEFTEKYYCLNPFCFDNNSRYFCTEDRHFNLQQCKKWIINQKDFKSHPNQSFPLKKMENIQINFQKQPIQALKTLQILSKSEWPKFFKTQQTKIKKEITSAIQVQFEALRIKTEELFQTSSIITLLREYSKLYENNEKISELINEYYKNNNSKVESLRNHVLFKKLDLKERTKSIKSQIQKIYTSMMEDKTVINQLLTHQEQRAYHEYIFQPIDNYYNKLQVISAALNRPMTNYSFQNEKISLQCIACPRKIHSNINPANKKVVKKYLAEQILIHTYCDHYQQVGFAFSRKIAKTHLIDIKFEQFLQESKLFKTIKIIDRQSGTTFQQNYNQYKTNPLTYTLQIISLKNIHMAKGKHLLVGVHESIDLMIGIIAYICSQRDQTIQIQSKKQSLKNGLKDILFLKKQEKENLIKLLKQEI